MNFVVAGCQKCATTSLHNYLQQHHEIFLPKGKEGKFFIDNKRYKDKKEYEIYCNRFLNVKKEKAIGQVDPDYIYFPIFLERLSKHVDFEKLKFIFIFRNPVERAFSHYLMSYRRGIETKSFTEAIECEPERIKKDFFHRMHFSYVDRGFYFRQLIPFFEVLRPEQMLFLLTEDLKYDKSAVLKKCFKFLEVDSNFKNINATANYHRGTIPKSEFLLNAIVREKNTLPKKFFRFIIPNKYLRHKVRAKILEANQTTNLKRIYLKEIDRIQLVETYKHENQKLGNLINLDLSHWDKINA